MRMLVFRESNRFTHILFGLPNQSLLLLILYLLHSQFHIFLEVQEFGGFVLSLTLDNLVILPRSLPSYRLQY